MHHIKTTNKNSIIAPNPIHCEREREYQASCENNKKTYSAKPKTHFRTNQSRGTWVVRKTQMAQGARYYMVLLCHLIEQDRIAYTISPMIEPYLRM